MSLPEGKGINYAYLDKGGILHIVDKDPDAQYARNGKIVETTVACRGGYPVITYGDERTELVVYSLDKAVVPNGSEKTIDGTEVDLKLYPEIYELYKSLM